MRAVPEFRLRAVRKFLLRACSGNFPAARLPESPRPHGMPEVPRRMSVPEVPDGMLDCPEKMPSKTLKTFEARDSAEWRTWLATHHDSESEVWLVFHKQHTGEQCIAYTDALDEALCFGWVDSLVKRLDDQRYARKFTPRKLDSKWSTINRKRYVQLQASGRLTPAGMERPPSARNGDAPVRRVIAELPPYIEEELQRQPQAQKFFEKLAPSCRREYIGWIDSAKRPETKARRLAEAIGMLAGGKKLGLK